MSDDDPAARRLAMLQALVAKGADDPFVWYARAMELRTMGRLDEALAAFGEVEQHFPAYVPTYLMAGQVAEALGRLEEASGWLARGMSKAEAAGDGHARSELEQALSALGTAPARN